MTRITTHGDADPISSAAAVAPIVLGAADGEAMWFLGVLATAKASSGSTAGRVAVVEHVAPRGSSSPLHVHRNGDEWCYVTEGELSFWVGGQVFKATAGSLVYGPRDIPHTFTVSSEQARFLLVVEPPDVERLAAVAAEHGIEILGPPGIPA